MRDRALVVGSFLIGLLVSFLGSPPDQATGEPHIAVVSHTIAGPEVCHTEPLPEPQPNSEPYAVIKMLEFATVAGDDIQLGHVACLSGEAQHVEALRETYIGTAPLLGAERVLAVAVVPLRLRQAGFSTTGIQLISTENEVFTVQRKVRVVSGPEIAKAVQEALLAAVPHHADATVVVEDTDEVHVPAEGEIALEVGRLPSVWHGRSTVPVGIAMDGKTLKTVRVRVHVELYTEALVATTMVRRGEPLNENNVALQRVPLESHLQLVHAVGEHPLRATRTIQAGSVIEQRFAEPVPDALKGHHVILLAETEGIMVSASGEVLREGYIGDMLPVRNLVSGALVVGRLVGPDHVQVQVAY